MNIVGEISDQNSNKNLTTEGEVSDETNQDKITESLKSNTTTQRLQNSESEGATNSNINIRYL